MSPSLPDAQVGVQEMEYRVLEGAGNVSICCQLTGPTGKVVTLDVLAVQGTAQGTAYIYILYIYVYIYIIYIYIYILYIIICVYIYIYYIIYICVYIYIYIIMTHFLCILCFGSIGDTFHP